MTDLAGPRIEQKHTTVPFSYRARLSWREAVPTRDDPNKKRSFGDPDYRATKAQVHHMTLAGRLHPEAYTIQEAAALFAEKIQPLLDLGWALDAVHVKGYDEVDA